MSGALQLFHVNQGSRKEELIWGVFANFGPLLSSTGQLSDGKNGLEMAVISRRQCVEKLCSGFGAKLI